MKAEKNRLMPEEYLSVEDFIVYAVPYNFVVAKVGIIQKEGPNKGKETTTDESYHVSLKAAYSNILNRISHESFPDILTILNRIETIEDKVDELLSLKYSIQG